MWGRTGSPQPSPDRGALRWYGEVPPGLEGSLAHGWPTPAFAWPPSLAATDQERDVAVGGRLGGRRHRGRLRLRGSLDVDEARRPAVHPGLQGRLRPAPRPVGRGGLGRRMDAPASDPPRSHHPFRRASMRDVDRFEGLAGTYDSSPTASSRLGRPASICLGTRGVAGSGSPGRESRLRCSDERPNL